LFSFLFSIFVCFCFVWLLKHSFWLCILGSDTTMPFHLHSPPPKPLPTTFLGFQLAAHLSPLSPLNHPSICLQIRHALWQFHQSSINQAALLHISLLQIEPAALITTTIIN
jgi:hypothetical protein